MPQISALIDRLRADLATLKLTERGTDTAWIDDEKVAVARQAVLRSARKFVEAVDAPPVLSGAASQEPTKP